MIPDQPAAQALGVRGRRRRATAPMRIGVAYQCVRELLDKLGIDTSADVLGGTAATQPIAVEPRMAARTQAWLGQPLQGGLSMQPNTRKARAGALPAPAGSRYVSVQNPFYLLAWICKLYRDGIEASDRTLRMLCWAP